MSRVSIPVTHVLQEIIVPVDHVCTNYGSARALGSYMDEVEVRVDTSQYNKYNVVRHLTSYVRLQQCSSAQQI